MIQRLLTPTRVVTFAWVLVLIVVVLIQSGYPIMQKYAPPPGVPKPVAEEFIPAIGSNTISPDLGVALSGGGSRAAYYTIGVLKGLYDRGYLQEADAFPRCREGAMPFTGCCPRASPYTGQMLTQACCHDKRPSRRRI